MSTSLPRSGPVSAELVGRIARGDRAAFEQFYDAMAPLAFGLIRRILRERESAEEVLQEVFWQVWKDAGTYDPARGNPEAWLVTRARTRAIDKLRSIRRKETMFPTTLNEAIAEGDRAPEEPAAIAAEERRLVEGALRELPEAQRQVIEMAFFGGLTQQEIAVRTDTPLGTVKTRTRLGLERLRGLFKARGLELP
jgi:RNA polymerase sigma-70 factor (ECF subfamily)